jgi:hypothetical protein
MRTEKEIQEFLDRSIATLKTVVEWRDEDLKLGFQLNSDRIQGLEKSIVMHNTEIRILKWMLGLKMGN